MIMNKKDTVFGIIEDVEVNKDYTGESTDTAHVTVNNTDRTIKVDVNVTSLLGDSGSKAYPGNLGAQASSVAFDALNQTKEEKLRAEKAEEALNTKINKTNTNLNAVSENVKFIENTYATKTYVYEQVSNFSKISKQIVDSVDVDNNVIIVNGVTKQPSDGIVYLVKQTSFDGEIYYEQYTSIDSKLILMGTTKTDLTNYATIDFVNSEVDALEQYVKDEIDAIPEVDLTDYAKKSDIPDVSQFISAIPDEYITESELDTTLDPFATKQYVQAEISKVGTLSKEVVDSIDIENSTVTINGVTTPAQSDIVYLVIKEGSEGSYSQYTLIDNVLTWIGDTDVDLKGYATQDYVDSSIDKLNNDIKLLLNNIKFVNGGTSSSIII